MSRFFALLPVCLLLGAIALFSRDAAQSKNPDTPKEHTYLGFDRNIYPGDEALPILRKTFSFVGYWLNPPPGEKDTTWWRKRGQLLSQGFGFAVLYRGRETREAEKAIDAFGLGEIDANDAADRAKVNGFAPGATIFLDVEEGGRLPRRYHEYLLGWSATLERLGFHPGIYCSGIIVHESDGGTIKSADDIRGKLTVREVVFWIFNDACPPSPACTFPENPPPPADSAISYASIWQFAQSPRRKEFTAHCPANYHKDGNCYAPGDTQHGWFLDVNTAASPDPSGGAK